ncbi:MAG: DUF5107 domain-containing protein [Oscillospiraceae bacterium]|nr:DUF5107 domain-containing protein [Oscillospiraceae bacterium]
MTAKVWEEKVIIPTYEVGAADKNPIFIDKRVYQGSTGKVYPYPIIEKISDDKVDKEYTALWLENDYIKVMIMPELGGRIYSAYDKTNDYDFVYRNQVIKPALVGLLGPWISGGIEFNWPQHHRPTTFMPTDYMLQENADGSKSVLIHDTDRMYGTKGMTRFTVYPDKAYIEISAQLYNRTNTPQTFLWWANPAVAVNDHTQSIFPPDVHAVMDHGKRDVSRFPIATGTYYKQDYSEGVDISRYKNVPVPTSYMAEKSNFDFIGGYDYQQEAGVLHVANHHVSTGKKQWTWGCGDFGKVWDENLTDEDGPYIELMTGVYTDNQPDFTWLKPFEEKTFTQYFMPYKAVGEVKNASINAAVNLDLSAAGKAKIIVYATSVYKDAEITLSNKGKVIFSEKTEISPVSIFNTEVPISYDEKTDVTVVVKSGDEILVEYTPLKDEIEKIPAPAEAALQPDEIMSVEELFLTGQHIEQYRHATYLPDDYYLEGLKRDKGDSRINNAYGLLLLRRGCFAEAEGYFNTAIKRITWKNPNPYNSEAYYNLGLSLYYQGKKDDAYDAFFKATWTNEQQEMSFYYLAAIDTEKGNYDEALSLVKKGLVKNAHNIKARALKAVILRKLGKLECAKNWVDANLTHDPFDYVSLFERYILSGNEDDKKAMNTIMRGVSESYVQAAIDYAEAGCYDESVRILKECTNKSPMTWYYSAYYLSLAGDTAAAKAALKEAESASSLYCFPNRLEDVLVLQSAMENNPNGAKAPYYLALLWYDRKQRKAAIELWEKSAKLDDKFPTVFRNLALAYYNVLGEKDKAKVAMEKAFNLDKGDARVFLELDQLYKKLEMSSKDRLAFYDANKSTYEKRDDLVIEYITLLNNIGEYVKAYELCLSRTFHPWEGGEGKITTQYTLCLMELAKKEIGIKKYEKAIELLHKALVYPRNLGEGKLEGTKDNHLYYYLGCAHELAGDHANAKACFERASVGSEEVAGMMYYNDQPADMILYQGLARRRLENHGGANERFYKLLDYATAHIYDDMKIEYFAVSMPDFLIFNNDLNAQNKAHCHYLFGLGNLGIGNIDEAKKEFETALTYDPSHQNCIRYLREGI